MTLDQQIRSNKLRTWLILSLFLIVGAALGGVVYLNTQSIGLLGFFGICLIIYGIVSYYASGKMIAALTGAKEVTRQENQELYNLMDAVAISAGLAKTPPLYIIQDEAPNAFAAGRNPEHAYIAVTTGLLGKMDKRQLEAVLAHEAGHIVAQDVRLMSIVVVLVGLIALVSDIMLRMAFFGGRRRSNDSGGAIMLVIWILAAILAPIAGMMIQFAVSRQREYLADAHGVAFTGDPEGLALALDKLRQDETIVKHHGRATAHLYIESPTDKANFAGGFTKLFNTHPPLDDRIKRLEDAGGFVLPSSTLKDLE